MKFKGDIIITDPCYIMRKRTGRPTISDYPILKGKGSKLFKEYTKEENEAYAIYEEATKVWDKENPDDWDKCNCGDDMQALGITHFLTSSTIYGDWSCTTFNTDTGEKIGSFCADAGLVSVFLLDEVLAYNPDFNYHTERLWTTTLIEDFDGDINIEVVTYVYMDENDKEVEDEEVRVIGTGNINFYTTQTGF